MLDSEKEKHLRTDKISMAINSIDLFSKANQLELNRKTLHM